MQLMKSARYLSTRSFALLTVLTIHAGLASAQAPTTDAAGAVFVLSNQATGNTVLAYDRSANGTLSYTGTYSTGGRGAGTGADPLGSQGSLTLANGFLLAVNAGSNDVSLFAVRGSKLVLVDRKLSGGTMPVSIAVKGFIAYVVNAAGTPDISGFYIDPIGQRLIPLPNSQRPLAGGNSAQPADVNFTTNGEELIVTEKGTQLIDTYKLDFLGYASAPTSHASSGVTPFGFAVTDRNDVIVSEAGTGAVSSYDADEPGHLQPISNSVPLGQNAPCWLVATGDGRFAYTANAGSGTLSSLEVTANGTVHLLNAVAGVVSAPLDLAMTKNSKFLYVREGNGAVTGFQVNPNGSLASVGSVTGVPAGAQGIAAR